MAWQQQVGNGSVVAVVDAPASDAPPSGAMSDLERALPIYQQIMGLDAESATAMIGAGLIQAAEGDKGAAAWLLRRSLKIAPTAIAYNTLGHVLLGRRQWDEAINAYYASLALDPTNLTTWPNLLFGLDLHPAATPALRLAERRRFNDLHCRALTEAAPPHDNDPDPDRVLRVGYVSADWKQHSAMHGALPVILGAHADRVETHLYDVDQEPHNPADKVGELIRGLEHIVWHDRRGYDDATLAATIRADRIDILVDLSGYSGGGRPMTFARKPAPIQISGFGYATGLGIDAMDYIVADDVLIPPQHEQWYHEKPLRLPSFMGYEKAPPWPDVAAPPKLKNGYTTYGYLGRVLKISPQTLATWGEILLRDPSAHMLFKGGEYNDPAMIEQIRGGLTALGIAADRLEFRLGTSRVEHLAAYNDVDVMLDPFPHGAGVTAVESILMGVPFVTLMGNYVCGRTGASLLTTLGFKAAVARTPFEYVSHVLSTSAETWTLEDRQALRVRVYNSILMNSDAYASACEDAYRGAWRDWVGSR